MCLAALLISSSISLFLLLHFDVLCLTCSYQGLLNRIDGVMVIVFASSAVDRGFESRSGQPKALKICVFCCCFYAKHTALRSKIKYWLTRNQSPILKPDTNNPYNVDGLLFLMSGYSFSCQMFNYIP